MAIIAGGTNYASVFNFLPGPHRRLIYLALKRIINWMPNFRANNFQRSHLQRPTTTAFRAINLLTHSDSTYLFVSIELRACMAQTGPHVKSWKQITLKYGLLFPHYSPWVLQIFSVSSAISTLLWFLIDGAFAFCNLCATHMNGNSQFVKLRTEERKKTELGYWSLAEWSEIIGRGGQIAVTSALQEP